MRLPAKKTAFLIVVLMTSYFIVHAVVRVYRATQNRINQSRTLLEKQDVLSKEQKILTPHLTKNLRLIQNTVDTRDLIRFRDSYFAATSGGLLKLSPDGKEIQHFSVFDGLPESDLLSLAVFENKLYIGTQTQGILTFDGDKFVQIRFPKHKLDAVTNFSVENGRLLIATFSGGLLEFDGKEFREIKADGKSIEKITILRQFNASLFIGTFNKGIFLFENGNWKQFTIADGLASNRIVGFAINRDSVFVATDFGIGVLENNTFRNLKTIPIISEIESIGDELYVSRENGEISKFGRDLSLIGKLENVEKARLSTSDNEILQLTNRGIFKNFKPFSNPTNQLEDNFVSAISIDQLGNIWAGTFRNGIDVFSPELKRIKHLESENLKEINRLQLRDGEMLAATSRGLWKFDENFEAKIIESGSITDFSIDAIATNKGVQIGGKLYTTVNGLPSNSTYTNLRIGDKLYVGTLGGLAVIEGNRVVKTYTDSNSNLTNNWITSICDANGRIFFGTYGGGILELLPDGNLYEFSSEIGKFVVNPNALYSDGERLFAGTLDGLRILDLNSNRWSKLNDILPSQSVFGIASKGEKVYFATTSGILEVEKSYFTEVFEK